MVERHLAKVEVAGSSLVSRSIKSSSRQQQSAVLLHQLLPIVFLEVAVVVELVDTSRPLSRDDT